MHKIIFDALNLSDDFLRTRLRELAIVKISSIQDVPPANTVAIHLRLDSPVKFLQSVGI